MTQNHLTIAILVLLGGCASAPGSSASQDHCEHHAGGEHGAHVAHAGHAGHAAHGVPDVAPGDRASAVFRAEHAGLLVRLDETEAHATALLTASDVDPTPHIRAVAQFFHHELMPHAQAEEHVLYEVADRVAGTPAPHRFTEALRHEHTVVAAAVEEMVAFLRSSDRSAEGVWSFAQLALRTLGLVRGHFGVEESVVLEALDRAMTREEFEREVVAPTIQLVRDRGGEHHAH